MLNALAPPHRHHPRAGSASSAGASGGPSIGEWQESQQAALLGLRDEAAALVMQRASWAMNVTAPNSIGEAGVRDHQLTFPGLFGSLQEDGNYFPDPEHPGQMRTALQYMMLQNGPANASRRSPILLFAALPKGMDVEIRLPAFHRTTVVAECKDNRVVRLEVDPPERKRDVVLLGCPPPAGSPQLKADDDETPLKSDAGPETLLLDDVPPVAEEPSIVFEEVSEVMNFPGSPRVDPASWSFPSGEAGSGNSTMVLAGSASEHLGSTDGGRSWRATGGVDLDGLPMSVALNMTGNVGTRKTLAGNGVPDGWLDKVSQGPFVMSNSVLISADRSSGHFSTGTGVSANNRVSWGRLPAPIVSFEPSSGGITRYPDGMLLATVVVQFVPPMTPDGHVAIIGKPWFPQKRQMPCSCPWPYNCTECPSWAQCCNASVVAYTSTDEGTSFQYRGVVADKPTVNKQLGYSAEGMNENDLTLLPDNQTAICIMRRDSADGRQGWNGTYCTTDYTANTTMCGRKGTTTCPRGEAESSFVIGTSSDRGLSWKLRLAPSFMLSARPRAVTLEHYGLVLVSGGRPPLAVWATRDGEHWTGFDIPTRHNRLVKPAQRFCPEYSRGILNDTFQQSSAYTQINKLSPTEALVCYNRQNTFHFADCDKPPSQSTVFCMQIRDDGGALQPGVAPLPPPAPPGPPLPPSPPSPPHPPPPPSPPPSPPPPPSPTPPAPAPPAPARNRTQVARWSARPMAHGPSIVVSGAGALARWPIAPGHHRAIPQGQGCGQYVSTSTPVRSMWAVVSYGKPEDGWLFLVSVGFCHPGLKFSTLNGYSEPVGVWMLNNHAQLTANHSNSSRILHGEPYGKPWAVGANVSATIINGDNASSLVEFAVDGVLQGPAVPMGIAVPSAGLLGCAMACANGTALMLAT